MELDRREGVARPEHRSHRPGACECLAWPSHHLPPDEAVRRSDPLASHWDAEKVIPVTSSGGFILRRVFLYRAFKIDWHRLRVRASSTTGSNASSASRRSARCGGSACVGEPGQAHRRLSARHPCLAAQADGLVNLVYRDQLFPSAAYKRLFEPLREHGDDRRACKVMLKLLTVARERACEAELTNAIEIDLDA